MFYDFLKRYLNLKTLIFTLMISMSLFHIWFLNFSFLSTMVLRSSGLMFALVLVFLTYPIREEKKIQSTGIISKIRMIDFVLIILSLISSLYIMREWHNMVWRLGIPTKKDIIFGTIMVFLIIEMARRVTGNVVLPLVSSLFILYALFGNNIPGVFSHVGFTLERTISHLYVSLEGVYGYITGVMVRVIFPFILFGAFFEISGIGKNLIDIVMSVTKNWKDGPAQTAVISSGLFGSISGVGAANVMTTGSFTIPLMKRMGYKDYVAAAIEAAASSGGLILPPVMGAGVFIMVEWTGVPYLEIIKIAAVPAIIYYVSVGAFVHFRAMKLKVKKITDEIEIDYTPKQILKKSFEIFLPPFCIVFFIILKYTPTYAAFAGILSIILISLFKKGPKGAFFEFIESLRVGAKNSLVVYACCAAAGIIVGIIGLTGIGATLSSLLLAASKGNLFLAVFFVCIAGLILGMGLPVSVAYVVLVSVAGAALTRLGQPILSAHLIVFWAATLANVTPPVCVSAYAAASIAKADPMKTAFYAFNIAKGLFVITFLMAFTQILTGTWFQIIFLGIIISLGLIALAAFLEGYFLYPTKPFERILLGLSATLLIWPNNLSYMAGFIVFIVVILIQKMNSNNRLVDNQEDFKLNKGGDRKI